MMRSSLVLLGLSILVLPRLSAQEQAVVEQLAPVLAAEDAREWRQDLFQRSLLAPDSVVQRVAALAAGRIGDWRATPLLLRVLDQPDSSARVSAAFGLGLLRDTAAVQPLIQRLTGLPPLDASTAVEAVTALAKIGGRRSADFFAAALQGKVALTQSDPVPARTQILLESWRLGPDAPIDALLPFARDTVQTTRWSAVYSLGRLRAPGAANQLVASLRDPDPATRAVAARALVRSYAEASKLAPATIAGVLARAVDDKDPGVRINALRSLGTYEDSTFAALIAWRVDDPVANVRVQTASTLGDLGGSAAAAALLRVARGNGLFALRREAILGLARSDAGQFTRLAPGLRASKDWRVRATAAEGWAHAEMASPPWFLSDPDAKVATAGLQAWAGVVNGPNPVLLSAGRKVLSHGDAAARSVAAEIVARSADVADLPALTAMYARSARDSFPDAGIAALNAILAIRRAGPEGRTRVDGDFLRQSQRPANYLFRRWAEDNWPEAASRWGPAYPIATGRSLQDYRDFVRQFIVAPDSVARPHVFIETEQRGVLEVELYGPEAPLTVANFLRLVDRKFFDGNRWHRVVPNFVVQDGDPRGDGFGSPGGAIRDEINRMRYDIKPMLGMALSGPDTGSSQWFITLSPQPHLDGTYTLFGRAIGDVSPLTRITQGDVIRTVRR